MKIYIWNFSPASKMMAKWYPCKYALKETCIWRHVAFRMSLRFMKYKVICIANLNAYSIGE